MTVGISNNDIQAYLLNNDALSYLERLLFKQYTQKFTVSMLINTP